MRGVVAAALLATVSCSTIQSALEEVLSKVENYKFEGTGRAEGLSEVRVEQVTQMLRAAQGGQIEPVAMKQIWDIIEGLFAGYMTARNDAQTIIDAHTDEWATCHNDSSRTLAQNKYTEAAGYATNHETCRADEHIAYTNEQDNCNDLFAELKDHGQPKCAEHFEGLTANRNEGGTWTERISRIVTWFTTSVTIHQQFQACKDAADDWITKRDECDQLQIDYESTQCTACALHQAGCAGESDCYDRVQGEYDSMEANLFDSARLRMNHVGVLKYLQCFVNVVRYASGGNESTVSADAEDRCDHFLNDFAQFVEYNNTEWEAPARSSCTYDPALCPSHANWWASHYGGIHATPSPQVPHRTVVC